MHLPRRSFLQLPAAAALADSGPQALELGLVVTVSGDPQGAVAKVHKLGLATCFIYTDRFEPELAARLKEALNVHGVRATGLESLGPGKNVWNFLQGPATIGLVPRENRKARIQALKRASDFAKILNIPAIQTHCGFIPENPGDPLYRETVDAVREVAGHCRTNGQKFLFETGQETPITLLRTILDTGLDNVGVGLDTGNLILYGKGNPVDALDVLGAHVYSVHAKDGLFPTDPMQLGKEVPIGQGKVDFPQVVRRLRQIGYRGAISIERETSGPQQLEDVRAAVVYLRRILGK